MRIELAGVIRDIKPDVRIISTNQDFDTLEAIDAGYSVFEVICIGGGGGRGGGIDTANTGTFVRNYGGEGGGGGFQRVRGLLSDLPDICPVIVGAGGALGTEHASTPSLTTDGGDGGYSSFNGTTCRASGGKGGKRAQSNSTTVPPQAHGGEGGIGNRIIVGGGASGGICGEQDGDPPSTDGVDGPIIDNIGHGGGGGAGGVGSYSTKITYLAATYGGRGSYNPDDVLVSGPGEDSYLDPLSETEDIVPGRASGANASPLTELPTVYGQSGDPGIVVIRLTAE